jgi:hypothetical protein
LYPDHFPRSWQAYSDWEMKKIFNAERIAGQTTPISRWELINTRTGQVQPLLNAPQWAWATEAAWSPDSKSIVIANAYLPLDGMRDQEFERRKSNKFTVEVKVPGGEIRSVTEEDLKLISWEKTSNDLVFERGRQNLKSEAGTRVVFRKIGGHWEKTKEIFPKASRPEIVLEENMSFSPHIVAVDPNGQHRVLLLDLNPQFSRLTFGKVEEVTWKGADGIDIKAGLYYPAAYQPGKRYPLVIQTHWWTADRFWIDGPWTTAFAAQPLAGKGIMVLQTEKWIVNDDWWPKVWDTTEEAKKYVTSYENAVDYLDRQGLIDRSKVGIVGFSRTGFYVKYALTHSAYHFAAASVTDSFDAGYMQYVLLMNQSSQGADEFENVNGAKPEGNGLQQWITYSPGFNIDKVHSPILITALNPLSVLGEWEWFARLSRLGKPVDMIMIKDGNHELQRPWDRLISQGNNVDWFTFWLKGEEDPTPAKADQYKRWRELKTLQDQQDRASGQ